MSEHPIYKYKVPATSGRHFVSMPGGNGALPLSVAAQDGDFVLWARVNIHYPVRPMEVCVVMTGEPPPSESPADKFLGTVLLDGGAFVLHVWWSPR